MKTPAIKVKLLRQAETIKTFKTFGKLSGKPSELLSVALKDLEKVEQTTNYVVNMDNWYTNIKGNCAVCFAGSVMANTLKVQTNNLLKKNHDAVKELCPDNFNQELLALKALDNFREGRLAAGFTNLGLEYPISFEPEVKLVDYNKNPQVFKVQMKNLIKQLKTQGY